MVLVEGIFVSVILSVAANLLLNTLPQLNDVSVQGTVDISIAVSSLSECAAVCYVRRSNCDAIYYNNLTSLCTIVFNLLEDTSIRYNISGKLFRIKGGKTCVYQEYTHIWELDNCVKFQHVETKTWEEARTNCQNESGDLLSVNTALKENMFMPHLLEKYDNVDVMHWWIGLSDKETEGTFQWVNRAGLTYRNWDSKQPDNKNNNATQTNADCVLYFFRKNVEKSFAWFDRTCYSKHAFICENKAFL